MAASTCSVQIKVAQRIFCSYVELSSWLKQLNFLEYLTGPYGLSESGRILGERTVQVSEFQARLLKTHRIPQEQPKPHSWDPQISQLLISASVLVCPHFRTLFLSSPYMFIHSRICSWILLTALSS